MLYLTIFFLELLSLFFFSRLLTNSLARLFYFLTRNQKATISFLAALFLPGTIIHEMSHVLMAGALLVHTGEIEFIPQVRADGVKLGSAQIGITDPLRRALIGLAPVILGTASILGLLYYLNSLLTQNYSSLPLFIIIFVFIFMLSNTMFSSKKDLEGTLGVTIVLISFIVAIYLLGFGSIFNFLGDLYKNHYQNFFEQAVFMMLVPIVIDITVFVLINLTTPKITFNMN